MAPYQEFSASVLALYQPPIRRISTYRKMDQVVGEFGDLTDRTSKVNPLLIAAWFAAHPARAPLTAFTLLRTFQGACKAGLALGLLPADPFAFRKPRGWFAAGALVPAGRPRHHSAAAIARVMARARAEIDSPHSTAPGAPWRARRLHAVFSSTAYLGLRQREILGLRIEDIDLHRRTVEIRPNSARPLKTAGSHARLPIPEPLGLVLAEWLPYAASEWAFPGSTGKSPWFGGCPGCRPLDQLKALGMRAGVDGLTFQSLRHSYATLSEGWGIGELALQRLLRHTSPATQRHYRHHDDELLREAAARVSFG